MKKLTTQGIVRMYLFITFGLSILLSFTVGLTGEHTSKLINLGYLAMFIPAIALLALQFFQLPFPSFHHHRLPFGWILLAIFIFPVIIHVACLPVVALQNGGHLPWQPWLSTGTDGLIHTPTDKNWGNLTKTGLVLHILLNAIAGLVIVSALAFFEEIGWRAWLLPKLVERFHLKKAIASGAAICALWHIPFIAGGIHYIENVRMPLVILFYTCGQFGVAIILGWLWIRTENIWVVTLAHGSLNNWGQYAFKYLDDAGSTTEATVLVVVLNLSLLLAGLIVLFNLDEKHYQQA